MLCSGSHRRIGRSTAVNGYESAGHSTISHVRRTPFLPVVARRFAHSLITPTRQVSPLGPCPRSPALLPVRVLGGPPPASHARVRYGLHRRPLPHREPEERVRQGQTGPGAYHDGDPVLRSGSRPARRRSVVPVMRTWLVSPRVRRPATDSPPRHNSGGQVRRISIAKRNRYT